ncbi:Zinc finger, C3HC4 type (RING finger) [Rhizoctonia solani]|uniref:RING-type E3 ubiquitin transferase n=1 Tax=Rhizoctonia solani TaxID=456999 RepID=A0A8H7I249_9AGAM|nr:Zinc finger, C3HC4 type (RING finger) [Rhizoctonia solani]
MADTGNVSLEEIKASAARLDTDDGETEDHCIICLQSVEDRTVLINCAHDRMCFECIRKWTEQSRRCPLCNTPIGSHLIHRIRSEYDYQKFYLEPLRTSPPPQNILTEARNSYRARTRRPSSAAREIEQDNLERAIEKRRWVYRHGLFAKHIASNSHTRFRPNPTPAQISNSQELQSRCQMFVRRELRVWPNLDVEDVPRGMTPRVPSSPPTHYLVFHNEYPNNSFGTYSFNDTLFLVGAGLFILADLSLFLTSFILSLAKSIDIRTEPAVKLISEFLDINGRPSPAGGTVAEHFVHEFYSYLRSPFRDLPAYDAIAQYDTPDNIEPPPTTISRPDTSQRQTEPGPSGSRRPDARERYGYDPEDDPLEASPRDAQDDSELDMDERWIEVPPGRRGGRARREDIWDDEPRSRSRSKARDRRDEQFEREDGRDRGSGRERSSRRGRDSSRRGEGEARGRGSRRDRSRDEGGYRRSPTLGRDRSSSSSPSSMRDRGWYASGGRQSKRQPSTSRSPSIRDRKGKRRADDYRQRDTSRDGDSDRRGHKDKSRTGYDGRKGGIGERGATQWETGTSYTKDRNNDEPHNRNQGQKGKYNDARAGIDNDEHKGKNDTRKRWDGDDERGSAVRYRDDDGDGGKAHSARFPESLRHRGDGSSDDSARNNDQQPPYSSLHRFSPEDYDEYSARRRSHPYEERKSQSEYDYDLDSSVHNRPMSHEPAPDPRSAPEAPHRKAIRRKRAETKSESRWMDIMSMIRIARLQLIPGPTNSWELSVWEPKASGVERSGTALESVHPSFGHIPPVVDQPLSTQPGDNRETTRTDTTKVERHRAPRLTPLASIRAHLQGRSRSSDQDTMNEGIGIKASPSQSTTPVESSATNDSTLLPSAVERSSLALNTLNTNSIHVRPDSSEEPNGSSVSYSILGAAAAARSQVQPPLITTSSDSTQRVRPNSTVGRNRLVLARLEALRSATDSSSHLSENALSGEALPEKTSASPTLPDSLGNQSATNTQHDDGQLSTSPIRQLGADPADVNAPAARFQVERRLKLQARLAARKREINAVVGPKDASPL